ncbi:pentatricopeptide repeat-containing protein At4g14170-like isoform X1 [Cucurbita moschata]|uniref:Pentatricopeptide repeat-containing protein At4g14170-like isoform X1 n=1 Tax=Cucurbita moschata TaxID=3662 RepID=A0A6J1FV31_CUCMO|nr:pentatricopeptide repeat-containing protein At4g14170-like isoform X1 [Cucurbita moschata]
MLQFCIRSFRFHFAQIARFQFRNFVRRTEPNSSVHINLLTLCFNAQSLRQTKEVHAICLLNGLLPHSVSLCASLILNYAKFQHPESFCTLFHQTVQNCRTAFLWNTLIRAHSIAGNGTLDGLETYNRMVRFGVQLDDHTFPFVLKICSDSLDICKGMEVHGVVFKLGFDSDVYVGNTLLMLYGNCGFLNDAKKVFDEMSERDVVSWNTVIGLLSVNGDYREARNYYFWMTLRSGIQPNLVSVISLLPISAGLEDEEMTRRIHCYIVKVGLDSLVTSCNALVDAYWKCGSVKASWQVFDEIIEKNEVSWNSIINGLAFKGHFRDALDVFRMMIDAGTKPNSVTISSILPVFVELECFKAGKEIHGFSMRMGTETDLFIANSLIDMYAKSGHSTEASSIFHNMDGRNIVSWNAMIANYVLNGVALEAIRFVILLQESGERPNAVTFTNVLPACARSGHLGPGKEIHAMGVRLGLTSDLFVTNALTDMYAKCGCFRSARNVFNTSHKDEVSYNILITGYSETNDCLESLNLFSEMRLLRKKPDVVSFMGVISACANLAAVKQGKEIHGVALRNHLNSHLFVSNSLLDFYTKCGRIDLACKIFNQILFKDVASWNTMILGYGMIGELETAINMFEAMRDDKVQYDLVSYIAVLSACSHGGLVERGWQYLSEMLAQHLEPTEMHYTCLVDLLGRAGFVEEAAELIRRLPIAPDSNIWGALLGACRIYGNVELGCKAAEQLFELKPQHCGYYILLANMHAETGRWDEVNRIRELMKSRGAKKSPGCSWVQIHDQLHAFVVDDRAEGFESGGLLAEFV